jgi:ribosomal protein S18 acetylase RimI-like enzyme
MIVDKTNIDSEHICCAIGNDAENRARAQTKKDWMKNEFANGLVFRKLDQRGKVFIEYMPIESAWKPVLGEDYLIVNCLWVSGQFKGKGYARELVESCIEDARKKGKAGVAVVTSKKVKPFLTDIRFWISAGFEIVDEAEPYFALMAYRLNEKIPSPCFAERAKGGTCANRKGFTFIYSNQCVFMEEYVSLLAEVAKSENIEAKIIRLKDSDDAKHNGSPFGTLGIYYDGVFLTHELMTGEKFRKLLREKCVK